MVEDSNKEFPWVVRKRRSPTNLTLNSKAAFIPTQTQLGFAYSLLSPPPILRFTVGKAEQIPPVDGPQVAFMGRSNVGVSPFYTMLT
jgi:hypothetical protein